MPESESDYVSVDDVQRSSFRRHPWSLGGGGAAGLREWLEKSPSSPLRTYCTEIGYGVVTRDDDVYLVSGDVTARRGIHDHYSRALIKGEDIREWSIVEPCSAVWPYDPETLKPAATDNVQRLLWPYRSRLSRRIAYGLSQLERGLQWFEYSMFFKDRLRKGRTIAYGEIATHNHFVLDNSARLFDRT